MCERTRKFGLVAWVFVSFLVPTAATVAAIPDGLQIQSSGFRLDRRTGEVVQSVTVSNNGSETIAGKLALELVGLDPVVTVSSQFALTTRPGFLRDTVTIALPDRDASLAPGEQLSALLRFKVPDGKRVQYKARIVNP